MDGDWRDAEQYLFRGGLRRGIMNATWPDATLVVDRNHLSIRTEGMMDHLELRRADVTRVRSVRGLWSKGLRFYTADGQVDRVTYWTPPFRHGRVLAALRDQGWPVW